MAVSSVRATACSRGKPGPYPDLMEGFPPDNVVESMRRVLTDEAYRTEMVENNYEIKRHCFSYTRLEGKLRAMLAKPRLSAGPWIA